MKPNNPLVHSFELPHRNGLIKLHALSTGKIKVKKSYRSLRIAGQVGTYFSFFDPRFTEWMPIWTWVLEHPSGIILFDTGENSRVHDSGYFEGESKFEQWYNSSQFKFQVRREDEIDNLLETVGIDPADVSSVVLSHLHLDHMDGLEYFEGHRILVHRTEWDNPYGHLPSLFPSWFQPELLEFNELYKGVFKGISLTKEKDLWLIHTPGHTYGHCSLVFETETFLYCLAGDISYSEFQLKTNQHSPANVSRSMSKATYAKIKELSSMKSLVYLPSHDWDCIERLSYHKTLVK